MVVLFKRREYDMTGFCFFVVVVELLCEVYFIFGLTDVFVFVFVFIFVFWL